MSNEHITYEQIVECALAAGFAHDPCHNTIWATDGGIAVQVTRGLRDFARAILALRPAAQPVVEPFGYFRAEPFGWTDCKPDDEGAVALYTTPQPVAVPDRVPMTDELEQALEMLVEQCNQDAVLSGAQAVIHAEAVLERLYKSRTGITTPKADK